MSLPERVKVYLLQRPDTKQIIFACHDALLATQVKEIHREDGIELDIVQIVSSRRPQSVNVVEERCSDCRIPHAMSLEATADEPRSFDGICMWAKKNASLHESPSGVGSHTDVGGKRPDERGETGSGARR